MATTENITVLFTDLVGSTELASSLTPEAGDDVRRKHFSALRQAIATSGGTEVKNLGDGLMVVFPAASAALSCAVAMQQAVHRDNAGPNGLSGSGWESSAGEATREDDDYFGDPVIEAARLCARAEAGQILASDLVRANAGRRSAHAFTSLGELELKGLPEPIETLEVGWEPLGTMLPRLGTVPLPTRLTTSSRRRGHRSRERARPLGRRRQAVSPGRRARGGPSGRGARPGKDHPCVRARPPASRSGDDGAPRSLRRGGGCSVPSVPRSPLPLRGLTPTKRLLRAHVAAHGGELARLVPALGQRLGELPPPQTTDPDTERYLLYAAVVGLLEEASDERSGGPRARRPALGRQAEPAAAPPRRRQHLGRAAC